MRTVFLFLLFCSVLTGCTEKPLPSAVQQEVMKTIVRGETRMIQHFNQENDLLFTDTLHLGFDAQNRLVRENNYYLLYQDQRPVKAVTCLSPDCSSVLEWQYVYQDTLLKRIDIRKDKDSLFTFMSYKYDSFGRKTAELSRGDVNDILWFSHADRLDIQKRVKNTTEAIFTYFFKDSLNRTIQKIQKFPDNLTLQEQFVYGSDNQLDTLYFSGEMEMEGDFHKHMVTYQVITYDEKFRKKETKTFSNKGNLLNRTVFVYADKH